MGAADYLNKSNEHSNTVRKYNLLDLKRLHRTPWQQELAFWDNSQGYKDLSFTWCQLLVTGLDMFGEHLITKSDDVFIHIKGLEALLTELSDYDERKLLSYESFPYGFCKVELTARDVNQNEIRCTLYNGELTGSCSVSLTHPLVLESFLEGKDYHPYALDAIILDQSDCSYRRYRNGINAYPGISVESNIESIRYTLSAFGVTKRKAGSKIISYRNYLDLPIGCLSSIDMESLDIEIKDTIGYVRSILSTAVVQNLTTSDLRIIEQHWNSFSEIISKTYCPYVCTSYDKTIVDSFDKYLKSNRVFDKIEELVNLPIRYFIVLFNPIVLDILQGSND